MNLDELASVTPELLRMSLPHILSRNLTLPNAGQACQKSVQSLLDGWTEVSSARALFDLQQAGAEARLYLANAQCSAVSRAWAAHVLSEVTIEGFEHLEKAAGQGPTVILSNHASYIDSPIFDALVALKDPALADRIVHVAGPKVYQSVFRRFAAICLNTIPVQQSRNVAKSRPQGSGSSVSSVALAREVAKSMSAADHALANGMLLLLYPEGSRTRNGRMGPFLKGTYRYLRRPGTRLVPAALLGTGRMMRVGSDEVTPMPCILRLGASISVEAAGGAKDALRLAEERVSELLPESMRPFSTGTRPYAPAP